MKRKQEKLEKLVLSSTPDFKPKLSAKGRVTESLETDDIGRAAQNEDDDNDGNGSAYNRFVKLYTDSLVYEQKR